MQGGNITFASELVLDQPLREPDAGSILFSTSQLNKSLGLCLRATLTIPLRNPLLKRHCFFMRQNNMSLLT